MSHSVDIQRMLKLHRFMKSETYRRALAAANRKLREVLTEMDGEKKSSPTG